MSSPLVRYPPCDRFPSCITRECCGQGKYNTSWPNVVGMTVQQASDFIVHDNPWVTIVPVKQGDAIEFDNFCCNRVLLPFDENNPPYSAFSH
ncbi:hypothetical protein DH2020_008147 [Rehmannia glutinosa]|uniref:Uncharacterized protein n=1 Tax=Rehmannia glutinosa TaxID=99300 RepID=A0ABR0U054_REHGL